MWFANRGTCSGVSSALSTPVGGYTNGFGYDGAGNPTTWKGAGQGFNADNQSMASTYDGNGNPTTYRGQSLAFDAENRLTQYGGVMQAGYTGDDLRAWKQTEAGRTYFLYDGTKPVCELNASGAVTAINTWGHFGVLSRHTGTGSIFYAFGTHGNAAQRLDSGGNVLSTQRFDGFGSRVSTDNNTDPFAGFNGQAGYYTDWETGLQLLTHRYYDPGFGRFLTRDPASYGGGANLYEYCGDEPTAKQDPLGLFEWGSGILGFFASCSAQALLTWLSYLFDTGTSFTEKDCNEVAACLLGAISFGVSLALDGYIGPQFASCVGSLISAIGTSVAAQWCRSH